MSATVRIPSQLRPLSGGAGELQLEGTTVGEVLSALDSAHPGFADRLFEENGKLRRFVNVFVADEDVRFLQGLGTPVADGQTISIVPAVAGGCVARGEVVSC
jgi:molybdopterin synthase sulfur carrier subunit